ncbi:hypothetical protein BC567DRAFT_224695 [Phyllosticta citribraziliensis]
MQHRRIWTEVRYLELRRRRQHARVFRGARQVGKIARYLCLVHVLDIPVHFLGRG